MEHIIPWSIGGSNAFVTEEASRKANNDLGSEVDAGFANTLPIAIMRHRLQLPGHSGNIPPIVWKGESEDGHGGTMTISADGTVDVQLDFDVQRPPAGQGGPITVSGPRERIEPILQGMLRGMRKRSEVAMSSDGQLLASLEDFWGSSEQKLIDRLRFPVNIFDQEAWTRGIIKIVLAACHKILGPVWTFGPDAERLRQIVNNPRSGWPALGSVRGFIAGEWDRSFRTVLGKTAVVRNNLIHTVAVLPAGQAGQAVALVSLFGGNGVPEAAVFIGQLPPAMMSLLNSNDCLSAVMGYRVDPRSRDVTPITFEHIDNNTKRFGPTNRRTVELHLKAGSK